MCMVVAETQERARHGTDPGLDCRLRSMPGSNSSSTSHKLCDLEQGT